MALGMVQAGYRNSLCVYPVGCKTESGFDYAELLAELTTELELALKGGSEEPVTEEGWEDDRQAEARPDRKKEWEELLDQFIVLEVMLRQMLENGLGQQKEEQQKQPKKQEKKELNNDFELSGEASISAGRHKDSAEYAEHPGNSEFLQRNSGGGSEYFSPSAAGRQKAQLRTICLTCQTECDQKKQWKITE